MKAIEEWHAAFQRTVSQEFPLYLRWRGIEATLALAQSSHAKIVIIVAEKMGCRFSATLIRRAANQKLKIGQLDKPFSLRAQRRPRRGAIH